MIIRHLWCCLLRYIARSRAFKTTLINLFLMKFSDDEPPVFNGCPTNIVENIDSPNNTALVKWTIPEGTDNSGEQPIIKEVNGYQPNSRFTAGTHQLEYKIEDTEGNVGQSCWFNLWVRSKYVV